MGVLILMCSSTTGEQWYIVFTRAKYDHWIYRFINRDMGHVYAIKSLNDYQWLVVQPRVNITEVRVKVKASYPHIRMITGEAAKIVKVTAINTKPRGAINFFNCVEQVKALIGLRAPWCFTPQQLYNLLEGDHNG